jgi:hypothetical protein
MLSSHHLAPTTRTNPHNPVATIVLPLRGLAIDGETETAGSSRMLARHY